MQEYEATIGMEVHAEILTQTKMFCACPNDLASAAPNTHTCPVCLGMPGVLPVINRVAVEATVLTGMALNCTIPTFSKFDRKNYHYPDLPKGYQISQYDLPLCTNGYLEVLVEERSGVSASAAFTWKRIPPASSTRMVSAWWTLTGRASL